MREQQFTEVQKLINTNSIVRELFSISNSIHITFDPLSYTITFGTEKKKTCISFKVNRPKRRNYGKGN